MFNLLDGVEQTPRAIIDWASISTPTDDARPLIEATTHDDTERRSTPGFREAQARRVDVGGAYVTRGINPYTPSTLWGMDYEHWTCSGQAMVEPILDALAALPRAKCSRIDVSFDIREGPPLDVLAIERHIHEFRRVTSQPSIETSLFTTTNTKGVSHTLYIGSKNSRRRICIYDKAAEQSAQCKLGDLEGEWWRVETRYRDELADHAYRLFSGRIEPDDDQPGDYLCPFIHVMGELAELFGLYIGRGQRVPIDAPPQVPIVDTLYAICNQHSEAIIAADEVGFDLVGLCRRRSSTASKATQSRSRRRRLELQAFGVDRAIDYVLERLQISAHARAHARQVSSSCCPSEAIERDELRAGST